MEAEYKLKLGETLTVENTVGLGVFLSDFKNVKIVLTSMDYTDESGESVIHVVKLQNPVEILDSDFEIGYMSKLNGQRWGINVKVDWDTKSITAQADLETPITAINFKLIV